MKRVLVVEDDPMVAMINMEYLSKIEGMKVVGYAINKDETFNKLENEEIDIILMDVFLGGENGFDILKEMRGRGYTTDVVMITSANGSNDVKKALSLGAVDYLIKPFDFDRFKSAIQKILERDKFLKDTRVTQEGLDELYLKNIDVELDYLPKGLNPKTLELVKEGIKKLPNSEFTIKDICKTTDISNVTIKKYLDYLEKIGYISENITYGNIGRPQYIYKKI
nr:response regulator [uncultured Cetobacterium sp.]